jgi:outer membrane receptor protein involved in Fe transport
MKTNTVPRWKSASCPTSIPACGRTKHFGAICFVALASCLIALNAPAQEANKPETKPEAQPETKPAAKADEQTIVLSPFVVDASKDQGYRATNTLAGSRINTDLKDLAASITEVTPQFLKDVSAADINDVLVYMAGTESTQNFTDAPPQGIGGFADRTSNNPQNANRIRGLNAATLTRDYFVSIGTNVGFDSYNIDRVSINRGPNSILFGLGDPSGVVNYSPKVAQVGKDANEVAFRFGSEGDWRSTVDFNKVLLPNKLALRVEGLWSDRGFQQKPSYYRDDRLNFQGTYKPFAGTTIQAGYEIVRQRMNNPNTITPIDNVTSWIAQGSPTWDPSTQLWSNRPANFASTTGGGFVGATNPNGSLAYVFQESNGPQAWAAFYTPNTPGVLIYNPVAVSNDKYVPLHSMNLNDALTNNDLGTFTASWDQKITEDLFLNVSYLNEDLSNLSHNWIRSNQYGIFIDVNTKLPDGSPNPHFGETFMPQRSLDSQGIYDARNESLRGTVSYVADLTKQSGWVRWLGRNVFTGYAEHREFNSENNGYNGTRTDDPPYLNPADRLNPESWQLTRLRYLGGSATNQATFAPGVPETLVSGVPDTYFDTTTGTWQHDTFGDFYALKRNDLNHTIVKSMAGIWQGYFWNGRIVGTLGLRHDENSQATRSSTAVDPSTGLLLVDPTLGPTSVVAGNTKTYGAVVHPFSWLSLHYNRSENFVPVAGDIDIFGNPLPPPSGHGKDYGFSFDLFEDKLSVKVNWYDLASTNARTTNSGPQIEAEWELPFFDRDVIPQLAATYGLTHTDFFSPVPYGDNRVQETADQVSKGIEIELVYNPTQNWRIMANASKGKASQSNIAPGLTKWIKDVLPTWQSQPWYAGPQTYDAGWGVDGNLQQYINTFNAGRVFATYKSQEGQTVQELREYHFNFINTYEFFTGPLKGWNVGGALRYESAAAIGYPALTNSEGLLTGLDLDHPYTDGNQFNVDVWTGYSRKIFHDRIRWNIQLNIRNLTQKNDLKPIVVNSDGTPAQFRIEFGPSWYITNTFDF